MTHAETVFLPGLVLSRILYEEEVRPVLDDVYPGLRHAAARVGAGSEVLGFDTAGSTVQGWGPRLELFRPSRATWRSTDRSSPGSWPNGCRRTSAAGRCLAPAAGPRSRAGGLTRAPGSPSRSAATPTAAEPTVHDWLAMPRQRLAEVTGGVVFHDGSGALTTARRRLTWYPDQVWRYLLACQWQRIAREEVFPGRCAEVGDDLGASIAAGRLVRDLMRLCLLLSRRYAPYAQWLGSAFARLPIAARLTPSLRGALAAQDPATRERNLCDAYKIVAMLQNATGLTEPLDPARRTTARRPFVVLRAGRFAAALARTLTDPVLREAPPTGGVDQWADGTDFLLQTGPARAATADTAALGGAPRTTRRRDRTAGGVRGPPPARPGLPLPAAPTACCPPDR